jgi:hypothetical protein
MELRAATDRKVISASLVPQQDRTELAQAASVAMLAGLNPFGQLGSQLLADDVRADLPIEIVNSDGTQLYGKFTPRLPGLHKLTFTDETGLIGSRLIDIRLQNDPEPAVVLEHPLAGQDPTILLPTATTTVQAYAEDRTFAVRSLFLEYRFGSAEAPLQRLPLVQPLRLSDPFSAVFGGVASALQRKSPSTAALTTIPVELFTAEDGRKPSDGDRIYLHAAADDYDTVSVLKQPGRSQEMVVLQIVSQTALDSVLQQELAKLRPPLLAMREQQRRMRESTEQLAKTTESSRLNTEEITRLGQMERDQRSLRNELADPRDGLQRAAQLLKDTIAANEVPGSTTTERVQNVAEELNRLTTQNLDPIEPLIASSKQEADKEDQADLPKINDELKKIVRKQQAAEATLDLVLKELEQWSGAGEVRAEGRAIKDQLKKANAQQTSEKVEPGRRPEELPPDQQAALNRAADEFNRLVDRTSAALSKAERVAQEKSAQAAALEAQATATQAKAEATQAQADVAPNGSPEEDELKKKAKKLADDAEVMKQDAAKTKAEAEALQNAVAQAGGQEMVNDLRTAAEELKNNNTQRSTEAQRSAEQRLDQFTQALGEKAPNAEDELKRRKELADEVDQLAAEQDELRKKVKDAEGIQDPMQREEALKRLEREQEAAQQLRNAAETMDAAADQLNKGEAPTEQQENALQRLDDTVKELDEQREEEKDKLTREQREELMKELQGLRDRLQAAEDEAERLQQQVLAKMGWDRARLASLGDLHDRIVPLAEELQRFAENKLAEALVFKQLVAQAAVLSEQAATRINERKLDTLDSIGSPYEVEVETAADQRTRRPLRTAIRRLNYVLDAIKPDAEQPQGQPMPMPMQEGEPPMPPMGGGGGTPPQNGTPPIAQLKALRAIQAELNERTAEFAKSYPDTTQLDDAALEELEELERSQREVSSLVEKLKDLFQKPQQGPDVP